MNEHGMAIAMGLKGKSTYFNAALKNTVIALKQRGGNIWGMQIHNIDAAEDAWLQVFDEEPELLAIEEITDGTGKINIKITAHGRSTGDLVVIAGTTSYNNADAQVPVAITNVDADNFTVVDTYVADEASGTAWFPNVILGTTTPKQSYHIFSGDGLQYGVLNEESKPIPIEFTNAIVMSITKTPTGNDAPTTGKITNVTYK